MLEKTCENAGQQSGLTLDQVRQELAERPLRQSSAERSWSGVSLDEFDGYVVRDMTVPARDHHVITVAIGLSKRVLQKRCGKQLDSDCRPGEVTMIPAGYRGHWSGHLPKHLRIAVDTATVAECGEALKAAGRPNTDLINGFRVRDPLFRHYAEIFRAELARRQHPAQELVMTSLATAFCTHVVRFYTNAVGVEPRETGWIESAAVRRVIEYLHETDGRPSLAELATLAGVSRFHFIRLFTKTTGLSPMRYLDRLRIERSKEQIRAGDLPLSQVALLAGYADQSHFTHRFRYWTGLTPAVYARENR